MSFGQFIVSQQENPQGGGGWAGSLMDHIRWKGKFAIFYCMTSQSLDTKKETLDYFWLLSHLRNEKKKIVKCLK